jgi:hypothetical protein
MELNQLQRYVCSALVARLWRQNIVRSYSTSWPSPLISVICGRKGSVPRCLHNLWYGKSEPRLGVGEGSALGGALSVACLCIVLMKPTATLARETDWE